MSRERAAGRSLAQWDCLVDEWRSSGQTKDEFAKARGINPKTFQGRVWQSRKRRGLTVKSKGVPNRFVEVSPKVPVESARIGGCRITMSKTEIEFTSSAEADLAFQILSKLGHEK
jgi:hypothetical protein